MSFAKYTEDDFEIMLERYEAMERRNISSKKETETKPVEINTKSEG